MCYIEREMKIVQSPFISNFRPLHFTLEVYVGLVGKVFYIGIRMSFILFSKVDRLSLDAGYFFFF